MAAKKKTAARKVASPSGKASAKPSKSKAAKPKATAAANPKKPTPAVKPAARPAAPAARVAPKPAGKPAPAASKAPMKAPMKPAGKPGAPAAGRSATAVVPARPVPAAPAPAPSGPRPGGKEAAFKQLRSILVPYSKKLQLKRDQADVYYLDAAYSEEWKREVFFGAVRVSDAYVSFHLMPVYVFPELLKGISPALKKRMQGKSCFNFKEPDKALFNELEKLTAAGYDLFRKAGLA